MSIKKSDRLSRNYCAVALVWSHRRMFIVRFCEAFFNSYVQSERKRARETMSQSKKRVHLFNCDNIYKLQSVENLLEKFNINVECVEKHTFRLVKMSEMIDKIPTLGIDMAFFVVHANESRLSINEDNAGIGYAKIYRALLNATGKSGSIVIG